MNSEAKQNKTKRHAKHRGGEEEIIVHEDNNVIEKDKRRITEVIIMIV